MFGYYQIVQKMAKILTISEQLHVYKEIENLFEGLTKAQRESIIDSLGLSDIFDGNGGIAPMYSLDIISDSEDGFLIEDGNVSDFAEKLSELMQNPQLILQMGALAKHNMERFSEQEVMGKWEKLFSQLTKGKK